MGKLTRGNLLAVLKELKKHPRPKSYRGSPVAVQAICPQACPSDNTSCSEAVMVRRNILLHGVFPMTVTDKELFSRLTTLQTYRTPYAGKPNGELFIHWFYRGRAVDSLSSCEIFHLNMLQYFNVMGKLDAIHVRCVYNGPVTEAMQKAIDVLSSGHASVDFKMVPQKKSWEHDTIKEAVEYSVATGKFVYYTHFKGVSRLVDDSLRQTSHRHKYREMDILYWCYLLYAALFSGNLTRGFNGVLLRNGCNVSYAKNRYDCSWCAVGHLPKYHYAGSFQSFDGAVLKKRFDDLGLSVQDRERKLWVRDPYTVEMFLSLCARPSEISFAHICVGTGSYTMYSRRMYGASLLKFINLYNEKPVFKIRSKYVVLTYLYGKHSLLREPQVVDENVEYVCISDRDNVVSKHWKIVVNPLSHLSDDRLRVAYIKFNPFEFVRAEKVLVLDASYQIHGSILPLFENATSPIMLLPHLYRSKLCEELDIWVKLGRMTKQQVAWFKTIVPYLGGNLDEPLFELSASVWSDTPEARLLGMETYGVLEYNGFPSNQIPCSLLAERHFKGYVGAIDSNNMSGLTKYKHNSWEPCSKQSYVGG